MKFASEWRRATAWLRLAGPAPGLRAGEIGSTGSTSSKGKSDSVVSMPFCVSYGRAVFCMHLPESRGALARDAETGPEASSSSGH